MVGVPSCSRCCTSFESPSPPNSKARDVAPAGLADTSAAAETLLLPQLALVAEKSKVPDWSLKSEACDCKALRFLLFVGVRICGALVITSTAPQGMSYLRPTCSDAAVRATNLGLSRFLPALKPADEDAAIAEHTLPSDALDANQRLPSRRPIDRRWDESRGLIVSRKANTMRNHTWTPGRGIVLARGFTQSRAYATRPSAGVPRPVNSVPSGSNDRFGSAMPSLERPDIPSGNISGKAPKQSEYEQQIKEKDTEIKILLKTVEESKDRCLDLEVQISDIQEEHKRRREE